MNRHITTLLAASALLAAPAFAQDIPEEEASPSYESSSFAIPEVEEALGPDQGQEVAVEAQETPVAKPTAKQFATAEDQVKAELTDKNGPFGFGSRLGFQAQKNVIVQIGTATFRCDDLATGDFIGKRDIKALEAYLTARAAIGRSILNTFSAVAVSEYFDPEDPDPKVQAAIAKRQEVEARKADLARMLAELDSAQAAALRGVTLSDRFGSFLDGVIKKLDASYDPATIAQEKMDRCNAVKAAVENLKAEVAELDRLSKEAMPKKNAETMSASKVTAKLRFFGCTTVAQAESWDPATKNYQVAVGVIWSRKLNDKSLAAFEGNLGVKGKPGSMSFDDWYDAQLTEKLDAQGRPYIPLGAMVGSRLFTDNEGHTYFVGIGASKVPDMPVKDRGSRVMAVENARLAAMFALMGDGVAVRTASRSDTEYNDNTSHLAEQVNDAIKLIIKETHVEGMDEGTIETVINPLSGQKIYVSVLTINPYLAAAAEDMMETTKDGAVQAERTNQLREGNADRREAEIEAARRDRSAYQQGLQGKGQNSRPAPAGSPGTVVPQAPRGGVSSAGTDWDMDF